MSIGKSLHRLHLNYTERARGCNDLAVPIILKPIKMPETWRLVVVRQQVDGTHPPPLHLVDEVRVSIARFLEVDPDMYLITLSSLV